MFKSIKKSLQIFWKQWNYVTNLSDNFADLESTLKVPPQKKNHLGSATTQKKQKPQQKQLVDICNAHAPNIRDGLQETISRI